MLFKSREKDKLFKMLLEMSTLVRECSKYFYEFRIREQNHLYEFYTTVKSYEEKNHELLAVFLKELNRSLITPIEREDILYLADHLDGILNWMDECASRFEMYDIHEVTDEMRAFTEYVNKCTIEIHTCVELLSEKRFTDMMSHIIKVREYEAICDVLERQSIKKLFTQYGNDEVIKLIQHKELYETLERSIDHCKDVAKVLESIIMKNA